MRIIPIALFAFLLSANLAFAQTVDVAQDPLVVVTLNTVTSIKVSVADNAGARPRDYVILVPASTPAGKEPFTANNWRYLNNQTAPRPNVGLISSTVTLSVIVPGQYEARLYALTDAGAAKLLKSTPLTVTPTPIETTGFNVTTTRMPAGSADNVTLNVTGDSGQLTVPAGTKVTVSNPPPTALMSPAIMGPTPAKAPRP